MSDQPKPQTSPPPWLEDAVFYEIYPQSYSDSNGDGIGDLAGILPKLDYIPSLGVNAIWLNPCFVSPFQDAGYIVADYYQVAPRYGTNDDLVRLIALARRRGIRILLDLVPGHPSIQNPWFKESCMAEQTEYSDWVIWNDSPWTWSEPGFHVVHGYADRHTNYLTNFFYSQPVLRARSEFTPVFAEAGKPAFRLLVRSRERKDPLSARTVYYLHNSNPVCGTPSTSTRCFKDYEPWKTCEVQTTNPRRIQDRNQSFINGYPKHRHSPDIFQLLACGLQRLSVSPKDGYNTFRVIFFKTG